MIRADVPAVLLVLLFAGHQRRKASCLFFAGEGAGLYGMVAGRGEPDMAGGD